MGLLLHVLGVDDLSGRWYGFWSGIGSDLAEFAFLGALWHHLNCHEGGCWRVARHATGGYCRRHRRQA